MSEPVRLLRVKRPLEGYIEAHLTRHGPEHADATLVLGDDRAALSSSERLIIEWPNGAPRTRATVSAVDVTQDAQVTLSLSLTPSEPDARHYPRLVGGVALSFTSAPNEPELITAWLTDPPRSASALRLSSALDELMNFSVYGLAFESPMHLEVGEALLCELGLSRDQERWRTRAVVARSWPVGEGRHGLALQFTDPPSGLIDTLAAYTLELQKLNT